MYKVKFSPYRKGPGKIMSRQTKEGSGKSLDGRYRFYINEDVEDPDFWVVQGKGLRKKESSNIAPGNTLLLSTEPRSILVYPRSYIKQFGAIHSSQKKPKHRNLTLGPAILPWFVGFKRIKGKGYTYSLSYDNLINSSTPKKTKLISVITSNKTTSPGHLTRIAFVEKLKARYGDKIDVFGRGFRSFKDKWDVLAPYKYHISLENSSQDYYWTEKLSDPYLAECFPIYYGCTNISDYFPRESYEPIDINDFESAVEIIDRLIAEDTFENKQEVLKECKIKVLTEYNMFDYIASQLDKMDPTLPKKKVSIKPCRSSENWYNIYRYLVLIPFILLKQRIAELFKGRSALYHKQSNHIS